MCVKYCLFAQIPNIEFKRVFTRLLYLLVVIVTLDSSHFQMVAKGKDTSELFPAVVKNVAAKNLEVGH